MLSNLTLTKIADLISAIANAETQVDIVRQVLCEQPSFEPFSAFKRVSQLHSRISTDRLLTFLRENSSNITKSDAYHIIRLFDSDKDQRLSYPEFLSAILPRSNKSLKKEVTLRKTYPIEKDEGLPYQAEYALVRVFEEELKHYKLCERLRKELAACDDFAMMNAFRALDTKDRGYFDIDDLAKFLSKICRGIEGSQLKAFMQRADRDNDELIKFSEFLEIFYSDEIEYKQEKRSPSSSSTLTFNPKESQAYSEENRKENYISQLKDTYVSPLKKSLLSNKMTASVASLLSPTSTKTSFSNSTGFHYKTPNKKATQKVTFDLPEQNTSIAKQNNVNPAPKSKQIVFTSPRKESPLRPREEIQLVRALKEMIDHTHSLEAAKNDLAIRKDFNLYNAFAVFDTERKGSINSKQFRQGLTRLNIKASSDEIYLVMKRLDTDVDGSIRYGDFANIATPKSTEFAKVMASRLPHYMSNLDDALQAFNGDTIQSFRNFWKTLINVEYLVEVIRQRLKENSAFTLYDAFKALDKDDHGFINSEQLKDFLADHGVFFPKKDVDNLMGRYTKTEKGKAFYPDFVRGMTPQSPEKY